MKKWNPDAFVGRHLFAMPEYQQAKVILFYYLVTSPNGYGTEIPETGWLIEQALEEGKTVCLPQGGDVMKAMRIDSLHDIWIDEDAGGYPDMVSGLTRIHHSQLDLIIVESIRVDRQGWCQTCWDYYLWQRLLCRVSCPVITLAYDKMLENPLPEDRRDLRLTRVVSENGYWPEAGNQELILP